MLSFRIKHLAGVLMTLCLLCALAVPPASVARLDASVAILFRPVSIPARAVAARLLSRSQPLPTAETRSDPDLRKENESLRQQVVYLRAQLDVYTQRDKDRQAIGDLALLCTPIEVLAGDSGLRDMLAIDAGSGSVRVGMPVVYAHGLAGRIDAVGPASSRVRLVTDVGMILQAHIVRYISGADEKPVLAQITIGDPMVEGAGNGTMLIHNLTCQQAIADGKSRLLPGDWIVLYDSDWPSAVWNTRIGFIQSIAPQRAHPLFAEVIVVPAARLDQLREVQVLTRE
jgi:hypothetical protein